MEQAGKDERPVVALDIGGTKILATLVSAGYEVLDRELAPTPAGNGPQEINGSLFMAIDRLLQKSRRKASDIAAIGLAAAGIIDLASGLMTISPNLPRWEDIPLRELVSARYGVYAALVNDASAAALGEHRLGAGRGLDNMVYLTISTGIGGGLIVNGQLYLGSSGSAGELGHMVIDVNGPEGTCGHCGCLESLASGRAIARETIERLKKGQASSLSQAFGGRIESITARDVGAAARNGDGLAGEVVRQAAVYLGIGLTSIVNIFNPDMIVIGGGVAKMGELLLEPARQVVAERAFKLPASAVKIVPARLGDDAGVLGAALFARQQKAEAG
ncbi:MAG: ROK family protein [Dehalococcoidales bacterium]